MASVVFLRGANVGGHKVFRPSVLARELAALEVISVGAAGTFAVRARATVAQVRAAFIEHLPVEAQLMVCPAHDVTRLVKSDPFGSGAGAKDAFVSVIATRPRSLPCLPLRVPDGRDWQVEVAEVRWPFALSRMRRLAGKMLYPNEVVEKCLGVAATTRGWPTLLKIREALG